ncbi:MAG: hypothetical protein RBU37_05425 [Myxococcota bacterium]|jgi:hypothetical protein|nr:hypothetical protein [Myxococcota bacterium]
MASFSTPKNEESTRTNRASGLVGSSALALSCLLLGALLYPASDASAKDYSEATREAFLTGCALHGEPALCQCLLEKLEKSVREERFTMALISKEAVDNASQLCWSELSTLSEWSKQAEDEFLRSCALASTPTQCSCALEQLKTQFTMGQVLSGAVDEASREAAINACQ